MPEMPNLKSLQDRAGALVDAAVKAGADAADAVVSSGRSTSVTVRMGKAEATEASEGDGLSLRVFVGRQVASISANIGADQSTLAARAVAMAKAAPEDPWQELAPKDMLITSIPDLDLFDSTDVSAASLTETALELEAAALAVPGISNSGGSSASAGLGGMVLVTSSGFTGSHISSRFGRGISAIAGEGTKMQRDYEFSSRIHFAELEDAASIGHKAGERTVRRLNPSKAKTGPVNVVFDPRVARGFAGHLSGAINGASVARKTSFLRDKMGEQILAANVTVTDNPLRLRGSASRPFDGEGVAGQPMTMVDKGVLKHWFLSHAVARELGLQTNGRGARSGSSVSPTSTNFAFEPGDISPEDLIRNIGTGLYVTEVIGQGVNMITGEYSRGASGYWIENGVLTHPVSEVTIAGNLKDMFMNMILANDLDRTFGTAAPTLAITGMTLAGE
ncbi:MAG: TldD/PmbA family protein [Rhizobiaceae bacterium]